MSECRIRIGNQTCYSASPVTVPFEYALSHGFDAFEWFPDKRDTGQGWTEYDITGEMRTWIRDSAVSRDIALSVHAQWHADPLVPESRETFKKAVDLAQDIGAGLVNIHLFLDAGIQGYADAVSPLAAELARRGMRLSVENTPLTGPRDFNELFRRLGKAGANVGMCLDLGHANLCEQTRNDYLKFIDMLGPHVPIIHIHLHENYGDSDSHLPLFTGPSRKDDSGIRGLVERLRRRSFSGSMILEQWPQPESLLDEARDRLVAMVRLPVACESGSSGSGSRDMAEEIAHADRERRSWRRKLAWIDEFLSRAESPTRDDFAYLAIYLRLIGTGVLTCEEEGGHYRPSHHARTAEALFTQLSQLETPDNALIIRKIYPWLPSFDSAFTNHEPLTRIRDIAHRNDIPRALKDEIKRTLQNKLHRSAGPEDLATSAALLDRLTSPGSPYPPEFVQEFSRFHDELREFFGARSLEEQLEALAKKARGDLRAATEAFLSLKRGKAAPEQLIESLRLLTLIRRELRKSASRAAGPEAQQAMLTDIRLEDHAFVLLSQINNRLDTVESEDFWAEALPCLSLAIENLLLAGISPDEGHAVHSELHAWSQDFMPSRRTDLLRLLATVERCQRLAGEYCSEILSLFPDRVTRLGEALGIATTVLRHYPESEIRSHIVFQLSRLSDLTAERLRKESGLPPVEAIVTGTAEGRLVIADDITGTVQGSDHPVIAILRNIDGDEEVPDNVVAIIGRHATPHLSHLAIRARQRGIVFGISQDAEQLADFSRHVGQPVSLALLEDSMRMEPLMSVASWHALRQVDALTGAVLPPEASNEDGTSLIPLDAATAANAGAKAVSVRKLHELSHRKDSCFATLPAAVVPFAAMERALSSTPGILDEYRSIVGTLNGARPHRDDAVLKRLRDLVQGIPVSAGIIAGIRERFGATSRLMVRSSANSEDLKHFAGAGLYDSVANVTPQEAGAAITRVWASLWSARAVAGRRAASFHHSLARMAVLIQEMGLPDYAFVLHTANPVDHRTDEVYVELAAGMGEAIASAHAPGSPYRLISDKKTGRAEILRFASLSKAARPDPRDGVVYATLDYRTVPLSAEPTMLVEIAARLGRIGAYVERAFGSPQDVEGFIAGERIFLVQSRPQQGIDGNG
ncbi:MAG: PEP/pyruvate-binding domain-containing protein [Chloroflexota bacterium]